VIDLPPHATFFPGTVVSKRKLHYCFQDLEERNVCQQCWIKKTSCICGKVTQTGVRHNILLFIHYRG